MINALTTFFSHSTIQALGWSLIHFVWEGCLLAAVLWASLLLSKKAQVRYALAFAVLVAMTLMPVINFVFLRSEPAASLSGNKFAELSTRLSGVPSPDYLVSRPFVTQDSSVENLNGFDAGTAAVWIWLGGVVLFSIRTVGGWLVLRRLKREVSSLSASLRERCRTIQQRFSIKRKITFVQSASIDAPAVVGWLRPIVLVPLSTLAGLSPDQFEAVIAHELAHIKRFDYLANLFQLLAETVLFYHPAVWWVNRVIRTERENCCDDLAVPVAGSAVEYAKALARMEESRSIGSFALAANGGSLMTRISRILNRPARSGPSAAAVLLAVAGLTGSLLAATKLSGGAFNYAQGAVHSESQAVRVAPPPAIAEARQEPEPAAPRATALEQLRAQATVAPKPQSPPSPSAQLAAKSTAGESGSSYISDLAAAGYKNLTADQLIALKIQGVTPQYISEMKAAGLDLDVDELVAMRVQGVTPEYVRQARSGGWNPTADQIIAMKVQGVKPSDASEYTQLGLSKLTIDEVIAFRVQGITPDYVRSIRSAGFTSLSADDYIAMKVQGVTPEYIQQARAGGWNPTADQVIAMKVQGVKPSDASEYKQLGLPKLTIDEVIAFRVQGITPEYVRSIRSAGFTNLSADNYITMKAMGVTPEFINRAREHGFKDLSIDQVISLKATGVL